MTQPPDRLVPDASVAVKWFVTDEPNREQAAAILVAYTAGDLGFVAPSQFRNEVPAALRAATRRKPPRLARDEAEQAIGEFLAMAVPTVGDDRLISEAFAFSYTYDCGFYDALYLALAQRLGVPFLTADNRLYQHIRHLPDVLWLADWRLPR